MSQLNSTADCIGDCIGDYMGDIYGCVDGMCKKCYRCNPILYWGKRRTIPRFDMVLKAVNELKEYDNKKCNSYINAIEFGLIDTNYNLKF